MPGVPEQIDGAAILITGIACGNEEHQREKWWQQGQYGERKGVRTSPRDKGDTWFYLFLLRTVRLIQITKHLCFLHKKEKKKPCSLAFLIHKPTRCFGS